MLYRTTEATDFSFDFRVNEILRRTEKGRDPLPVFDGDPAQARQALEQAFPKVPAAALDRRFRRTEYLAQECARLQGELKRLAKLK